MTNVIAFIDLLHTFSVNSSDEEHSNSVLSAFLYWIIISSLLSSGYKKLLL